MRDEWWDWSLRFYYGKGAMRPRVTGELAAETVHRGETSRDMEINAGKSREDIGRIEMRDLRAFDPWKTVWEQAD